MDNELKKMHLDTVLTEIADVMAVRREASPESSYVSQLLHAGEDKILKKVIEEAGEVLMASKDGDKLHLIKEVADVWFHTMVLLTYHGLRPEDVLMELKRRQNISGLDEKASRK
ncbi:phosphoribosyl-ATP diphosphatase [Snodgrassella sp. CFCC 13594]|uniref:phosphoribosyl-ATP diphosphatase n=1 Tax=Snodgrassella sp. CFCC 13594 TaxID=1775559 RepID=UPI000B0D80BA